MAAARNAAVAGRNPTRERAFSEITVPMVYRR